MRRLPSLAPSVRYAQAPGERADVLALEGETPDADLLRSTGQTALKSPPHSAVRGERDVNLKNPIPVYLTYQTVFFDQAGQIQTRPDIYGLDKNVTALLKGEPAVAHIPVARNYGGTSSLLKNLARAKG